MADSSSTAGSIPVQNQDWLVGNPSGAGAAAALWIGSAGLLVLGVLPILYGALHAERRVNLDELGLESCTLKDSSLTVDDERTGKRWTFHNISLSVERKNFAQQLYLSEGYRVVDSSDAQSDTMVKSL